MLKAITAVALICAIAAPISASIFSLPDKEVDRTEVKYGDEGLASKFKHLHKFNGVAKDLAKSLPILSRNLVDLFETAKKRANQVEGDLAESYEEFLKLWDLRERDIQCTDEALDIIKEVDKGTHGKRGQSHQLNLVEFAFFELVAEHSDLCLDRAKETAEKFFEEVGPETSGKVLNLVRENNIIQNHNYTYYFRAPKRVEYAEHDGIEAIKSLLEVVSLSSNTMNALRGNAKDDPDKKFASAYKDERTGELTVNKDKIRSLYEKHIVEPCKEYVTKTEESFKHAPIYIRLLDGYTRSIIGTVYEYWRAFHYCKLATTTEHDVLLDELFAQAEYDRKNQRV